LLLAPRGTNMDDGHGAPPFAFGGVKSRTRFVLERTGRALLHFSASHLSQFTLQE
jgi:hypothetical protein